AIAQPPERDHAERAARHQREREGELGRPGTEILPDVCQGHARQGPAVALEEDRQAEQRQQPPRVVHHRLRTIARVARVQRGERLIGQPSDPIVENRAMFGGRWRRIAWAMVLLAALAGCGTRPGAVPPSNDHWLVVWAEDADRRHSDFL